ncbi:MAG: efflux RND transporter periplasmic adaptor subunit [Bacteroidales bacterium]
MIISRSQRVVATLLTGIMLMPILSCTRAQSSEEETMKTAALLPADKPAVSVIKLESKAFNQELISNGKLTAKRMVDLYFKNTEPVARIYVKNGQRVAKGEKLAELDSFKLNQKLIQATVSLEKSRLDLADLLIGQGYAPEDSVSVPVSTMRLVRIKSGYDQALSNYELAKRERQEAVLTAPFAGIVANLFMAELNAPSLSVPFCRLIDPSSLEAAFTVLESELPMIHRGDKVRVQPFSTTDNSYTGIITEVNPLVESSGMVQVRASVNGNDRLFEGMNVQINILRVVPDQWVVPKSAVVLRSGKQVVFTLREGKAIWNYVNTALENEHEYTIRGEEIQEGDLVIVDNNINLAHEAPVNTL